MDHFFLTYKNLEAKDVQSQGWVGLEEARKLIDQAIQAFRY